MTNVFEYTKQEVQQFLETEQDRTDNLKRALTSKGYEVSTNRKRGEAFRFILNKKLVAEVDQWTELFGFKPSRQTAAKTLLLFLHEQGKPVFMTDDELAFYTTLNSRENVRKARQELAKAGYIVETRVQKEFYRMGDKSRAEHYIDNKQVQSIKVAEYFSEAEFRVLDILEETDQFLTSDEDMKDARKDAMKKQVEERGNYYVLYRKELAKALTPEQVKFLKDC